MHISVDHFGDIHLHAASVRDWTQTYSQIVSGPLRSSLFQISGGRFRCFREFISRRVVQHGEAPRGRICFAVPLTLTGPVRIQGREVDDRSVLVLRSGEEFMLHVPSGMDLVVITFDQAMFEQAIAGAPQPGVLSTLLKQPVVQVAPRRLGEARGDLLKLFEDAFLSAETAASPATEQQLEAALMAEFVEMFADPACDKHQRHGSSSASYIVAKCHRLAVEDTAHPPSVFDICQRLRISRRTVQNAFRSVAETTPLNYLRCVRLNGVRRELMASRSRDLTIGDAAARWGFFHLSHFATDYRSLFSELPSQTRRADGRGSSGGSNTPPPTRNTEPSAAPMCALLQPVVPAWLRAAAGRRR